MKKTSVTIYGFHTVKAALASQPEQVLSLFFLKGREDARGQELRALAANAGVSTQVADRSTLDKLSEEGVHQGFVATLRRFVTLDESDLQAAMDDKSGASSPPFLLVLEGIQDPQNLGAVLRTAAAAAVDGVVISQQDRVGLTGAVCKVSSGAIFSVPIYQVSNLVRSLTALKRQGIWLVGTALADESSSLYDLDLNGPLALVMGAEGKGLKQLTRQTCDYLAKIPMTTKVGSLNVSVSTGICLFEAQRQRQVKG